MPLLLRLKQLSVMLFASSFSLGVSATSLLDAAKSAAEGAVDTAGKVVGTVGDAVSQGNTTPAQARAEIDQRSQDALARLFKLTPAAKTQFDQSAGFAVFDSRKLSFLITTEFGSGVAVDKAGNQVIYMKMAGGGMNVGAGAKFYQIFFFFPDRKTFLDFVGKGWSADTEVAAVGGKERLGGGVRLANGVIVHELTDTGLALSATLTGTRYWRDEELNK